MHGIVSLLDDQHTARVADLWAELQAEFGLRGVYVTPFPHFSFHVGEGYDLDAVHRVLEEFSRATEPFWVRTAGLGVFTSIQPVLYLSVVRTIELSDLHRRLWHALDGAGTGVVRYYHPSRWVPHVTLAQWDVDASKLGAVVSHLSGRDFDWEIPIDNLAYAFDTGDHQRVEFRARLGG
jgi:2'-5' RNA ligase